jgi:hypothetical protein
MAKLTKERILNVCKDVNKGMLPNAAAKKEGLPLSKQLIESGIIYKDPITGKWQAIMRIHDARYDKFIGLYKEWRKGCRDASKASRKETIEIAHTHTKVGMFRRIWNSIFG